MKVLVTGAGGFVGKALVSHLTASGDAVRGLVRNEDSMTAVENLGAEPVLGDITDPSSIARAVAGVDRVYHIAALFRQAGFAPAEFNRVNVEGTKIVLDQAAAAGVKNVIHCSTVGVHGHIESPPADENSPYNAGDPYQESKRDGELLFLDYVRSGKIRGSVVRPAMIYGPGDTRTLKLFKRIAERRFAYVGSGNSSVHFIDVRDLAAGFRLIGERDDLNGESFILAGETALQLKELVSIISALFGVPEPRLHLPVLPVQLLGSLCEAVCVPFGIEPPIFRRRVDFFTKDRSFKCTKSRDVLNFKPTQHLVGELIDIIRSYIQSGAIDQRSVQRPFAMLRTIEGKINLWDDEAHLIYGWNQRQAIGNVSHSLLSTRFPADISEINSELRRNGLWRGRLIHRSQSGDEIEVFSKWQLVRSARSADPLVLELNIPRYLSQSIDRFRQTLNAFSGSVSVMGSALGV